MPCFVAMDGDGTVEGFGGPVAMETLRRLVRDGHKVMAVGNHLLQSFGFDGVKRNGQPVSGLEYGKSKALAEWKAEFPGFDRYIVVDDNPSQYSEGWLGWEFFTPNDFLKLRL